MAERQDSDPVFVELSMPWSRSERRLPRLLARPLQRFVQTEASGGIVLLAAAAVALVWANLLPGSYERVWHTNLTIGLGGWHISEDLRHWLSDAAMTLFFLVVGLEIKRELVSGELRDRRVAALPAAAALGGMIVPAIVYLAFNAGGLGERGWGIPMATDIAFAVGVLAVLGRGLPAGLKVFLLTLAIVDDVGAIFVIVLAYSGRIDVGALGVAVGLVILTAILRRVQVRAGAVYLVLGVGIWLAVNASGVHPTIAGVAIAMVTPAAVFQRPRAVGSEARRVADTTSDDPSPADADAPEWLHLASLSREAVSPLARLMHALHPWTSLAIVPLFALANAGIRFTAVDFDRPGSVRIATGVGAGLVLGKVLGICLGAAAAVRLGAARLPQDVGWVHVAGVSALGGIGFTLSVFVAGLAFGDAMFLDAAKVGVLGGSLVAGAAGVGILARARRLSAMDSIRSGAESVD